MKSFVATATIIVAGLLAAASAQAMPVAFVHQNETAIIKVAQGCGPERHRGPYGHCRARYSCPAGWHSGPHGWHCFHN